MNNFSTTAAAPDVMNTVFLPPTDRYKEVEFIIRCNHANWHSIDMKPRLLYMPQLYGAGKTYLLKHAIQILSEAIKDHEKLQLQTPKQSNPLIDALTKVWTVADDDKTVSFRLKYLRLRKTFTLEMLRQFSQTQTIYIDIQMLPSKDKDFDKSLSTFILQKALNLCGNINPSAVDEATKSVFFDSIYTNPVQALNSITGLNCYWFICFDEVGFVESSHFSNRFLLSFSNTTERYDLVLSHLVRWAQVNGMLVMAAGRSTIMTKGATMALMSSTFLSLEYFPLGAFSEQDINTLLNTTMLATTPISLWERLNLTKLTINQFASIIYKWSGGIPRLVQYIFQALVVECELLRDYAEEMMDKAFDLSGPIGRSATHDGNDSTVLLKFPDYARNSSLTKYYSTFLSSVLLKQTLPSRFDTERTTIITADLLNEFCLYSTPHEDGLRVLIPKYLTINLQSGKYDDFLPHRSSYLANMLSVALEYPNIFDQGRILELILGDWFVYQTSIKAHLNTGSNLADVFPCFKRTFAETAIVKATVQLYPIPAIQTAADSATIQFNAAREKESCMCIADTTKSAGPDLLSFFSTCWICWSVKNYQSDSMGFPSLKEEIQKCLNKPQADGVTEKMVLVIVSTKLTNEIQTALSSTVCQVFSSGSWHLGTTRQGETKFTQNASILVSPKPEKSFTVPNNCQLMILGPDGLKQLIPETDLHIVAQYFSPAQGTTTDKCTALSKLSLSTIAPSHPKRTFEESARPQPPMNPLFTNPDQPINLEWMKNVFPQEPIEDINEWVQCLQEQGIFTVGDLAKQSKEDLRSYGIPGAMATDLWNGCHPDKAQI